MLAIDAHGTAIPTPPNDDFDASYGSLSNQILEFTAVVTDPKSPTSGYALRTFTRGEGDDKAFLTHVGRAFLVDATLQLVPNYNLRCQSTMPDATTLFQAPSPTTPIPANSLASYLQASGRVEAIWFPFSTKPWLKVWTVSPTQPSGSRSVSQPYNYIFSDQLPSWIVDMIKLIKYVPSMTPTFGQAMETVTSAGLGFTNTTDIWGPSKNTLLYVRDTTVTYTANGYAVQMKLSDVQQSVADFTAKFQSMLTEYDSQSKWPVNGPLEIRVTALDQTTKVGVPPGKTATTPVISALSYDSVAAQKSVGRRPLVRRAHTPGHPVLGPVLPRTGSVDGESLHRRLGPADGRVVQGLGLYRPRSLDRRGLPERTPPVLHHRPAGQRRLEL